MAPQREPSAISRETVVTSGRMLDVLGDDTARTILHALDTPKTVDELAEELDVPVSTTYRKVRKLLEVDLVERTNPDAGQTVPYRYRRRTDDVVIQFSRGESIEMKLDEPAHPHKSP